MIKLSCVVKASTGVCTFHNTGADTVRFKGEVNFDGREVARAHVDQLDLVDILKVSTFHLLLYYVLHEITTLFDFEVVCVCVVGCDRDPQELCKVCTQNNTELAMCMVGGREVLDSLAWHSEKFCSCVSNQEHVIAE